MTVNTLLRLARTNLYHIFPQGDDLRVIQNTPSDAVASHDIASHPPDPREILKTEVLKGEFGFDEIDLVGPYLVDFFFGGHFYTAFQIRRLFTMWAQKTEAESKQETTRYDMPLAHVQALYAAIQRFSNGKSLPTVSAVYLHLRFIVDMEVNSVTMSLC